MQVLHEVGTDSLLNLIRKLVTFIPHLQSAYAKAILKNHILMSQRMGGSCEWNKFRDKLVLF